MTHSYCLQQHQMYYKHLRNHLIRLQLYTSMCMATYIH